MTAPGDPSGEGAKAPHEGHSAGSNEPTQQAPWVSPSGAAAAEPAPDYPPSYSGGYTPDYGAGYQQPGPGPGYPPPGPQPGSAYQPYPPMPPPYGGSSAGYGPPSYAGGYPAAGYPPPPPDYSSPYGAAQPGTNNLAIASLVTSFAGFFCCIIGSIAAIVLGIVALNQIKQTRESGYGMAVAGIAIGAAGLLLIMVIGIINVAASH
ncbi:DUF4190 domain-containing protein [Mycobacterium sp. 1423905.2]|uniref:DUF4190 domain-containing protein n=1 Tax=Mycobacterium sp. 1423905.2 TaxID=1856859 RepID=UPI0009F1B075|nr:DUF4190 domain-containing protein [Mycobacterium sp. 1423905.2]